MESSDGETIPENTSGMVARVEQECNVAEQEHTPGKATKLHVLHGMS